MTPKRADYYTLTDTENGVLNASINVLNDAETIVKEVKNYAADISEENGKLATEHVLAIRDILKERTKYEVVQINRVVLDTIREIENELTSFDYVVTEASAGIMDYMSQQMRELRETVPAAVRPDEADDFEKVFQAAAATVQNAFTDIDSMYTFYGGYIADIIEKKVETATDRVSQMLVSGGRRACQNTLVQRINVCYEMSAQNAKIVSAVESLIKAIGVIEQTHEMLDTFEAILSQRNAVDRESRNLFVEAKYALHRQLVRSEQTLRAILADDGCFLGSLIRTKASEKHISVKRFVLRSYEISAQSLATSLDETVGQFKVVKETHWNAIREDVRNALAKLAEQIKGKAASTENPSQREDHLRMAHFSDINAQIHNKFHNATQVINPLFEKRRASIAESLHYTLQYIISQQLPFLSILSIQNYIPSDVCPLSADYQKFAATSLQQYMHDEQQQQQQQQPPPQSNQNTTTTTTAAAAAAAPPSQTLSTEGRK